LGLSFSAASVTDFCSGVDSYGALLFEHLVHSICITYPLLHAMLGTIERESYYRHAIAVLLWIVDTRSAFALLGGLGVLSLKRFLGGTRGGTAQGTSVGAPSPRSTPSARRQGPLYVRRLRRNPAQSPNWKLSTPAGGEGGNAALGKPRSFQLDHFPRPSAARIASRPSVRFG
jgi:hypothetical protein